MIDGPRMTERPLPPHAVANALYLALPAAFSAQECDATVALGADGGAPGPVYGAAGYAVDRTRRDVRVTPVARSAGPAWLFARLDELFAQAADTFALPVGPVLEDVQVLRYDTGAHFQAWHTDAGFDAQARRRLSLSVELSHANDYAGGALDIAGVVVAAPPARGTAHLFPSRALHRVTPVTRGTRWALVAWTGAPGA